jgi:hypothetical protein
MIAKCSCQFCGVNIEFDTKEFLSGATTACPKCGLETVLSVSKESAPPKAESYVVDVRLNSGAEFQITAVRLYEEQVITKLHAKKAEAMKLLEGVSTGIGAIGSIEWVLAASAVIGATEAALSAGASTAGLRLLQEAIRLEQRLYRTGAFVPVENIQHIEIPLPGLWRGDYTPKPGVTLQGSLSKDIERGAPSSILIHDGSDFLSVMTEDGSTSSIRWSAIERFAHRKL